MVLSMVDQMAPTMASRSVSDLARQMVLVKGYHLVVHLVFWRDLSTASLLEYDLVRQ